MASVVAETVEIIRERSPLPLEDVRVRDVVIGVFFTGITLSSGHAGAAFTPIGEIPEAVCCPTTAARMPKAGSLVGRPLSEILNYALDGNVLKSAIGVAALNGLSQAILETRHRERYRIVKDVDGFDLLEIQPHETVSLIGAFGPYIRRLKTMGNPLFIIEKNPQTLRPEEMKFYRPESQMAPTLERSDAVIITGTAIVNHSIDGILACLKQGHRAAIIGPTASMIPDAFFQRGINVIAGVRIVDPPSMIEILKQGGSGYHLLTECGERIAFMRD